MQWCKSGELDVWKWRLRRPRRDYVLLCDGLSFGGKRHGIVEGGGHDDAWGADLTGNRYANVCDQASVDVDREMMNKCMTDRCNKCYYGG